MTMSAKLESWLDCRSGRALGVAGAGIFCLRRAALALEPSIPGMGYGDRSPRLSSALGALSLTRQPNLQSDAFFLPLAEFKLLAESEIVKPAEVVGDGIYDAPIQSKHLFFAFGNYGLRQHSSPIRSLTQQTISRPVPA
jgi:hypothetical protein